MEIKKLPTNDKGEKIIYNLRTLQRMLCNNFGNFRITWMCKHQNTEVITEVIEKGGKEKYWVSPYCYKAVLEHIETKSRILFINGGTTP